MLFEACYCVVYIDSDHKGSPVETVFITERFLERKSHSQSYFQTYVNDRDVSICRKLTAELLVTLVEDK